MTHGAIISLNLMPMLQKKICGMKYIQNKKLSFPIRTDRDENANFITSDIIDKVDEIKKQNGKDIWLYGGANLIKTFICLGLIDVYKISLHPVVLGKGKPLFEDLKNSIGLKLLNTRIFKSGVIELTYQPE